MSNKKSFVMYTEYEEYFSLLNETEQGKLVMAIFAYVDNGELPSFTGALQMAFVFIKNQIDRDAEKWVETIEKRKEAGKMGGAPKGNNNASKQTKQANGCFDNQKQAKQANGCFDNQKQAKQANGFENNQKQAKQADNVNVDVDDNVNVNVVSVVNNTQEQQKRQYVDLYTQNIGIITPLIVQEAESFIEDGVTDGCICEALKESITHGAKNWAYARSILRQWLERGIKTEQQSKAALLEFKSKNKNTNNYVMHGFNNDDFNSIKESALREMENFKG